MARFSDFPVVEVSVVVEAPAAAVWELVTDINVPARFQDEFQGAEWDGPDRGLGATFHGKNAREDRQWETTSWVTAYTPEREFAWAVSDPDEPGATWTYTLEPEDTGTRLTFHRRLGPGPSGITRIIAKYPDQEEDIIERRNAVHRANMQSVVDGIKALAES